MSDLLFQHYSFGVPTAECDPISPGPRWQEKQKKMAGRMDKNAGKVT
jgi:hypothetical protein